MNADKIVLHRLTERIIGSSLAVCNAPWLLRSGFWCVDLDVRGGSGGTPRKPADLARLTGRNQTSATNRALLRPADTVRDTDRVGASPHPQSSKQVFQHGEGGRVTEDHGEAKCGASRGVASSSARSAILSFSVVLSGSPSFSVLKNLLAFGIGTHDR